MSFITRVRTQTGHMEAIDLLHVKAITNSHNCVVSFMSRVLSQRSHMEVINLLHVKTITNCHHSVVSFISRVPTQRGHLELFSPFQLYTLLNARVSTTKDYDSNHIEAKLRFVHLCCIIVCYLYIS